MTSDPVSRRVGIFLAAAYGIIPFVMVPDAADAVVWPRLVAMGLGLSMGLFLAWRKAGELFAALPKPLWVAWGMYFLLGLASMATAHDHFAAGYDSARVLVFASWLMLVAWTLQGDGMNLRRILRVLSVVTLVMVVLGLGQLWAGLFMWIPPGTYPPFAMMASSNYYGEGMLLLSVLGGGSFLLENAASGAKGSAAGKWKWVGLAAASLGAVATVMAHARTVQLGLALVLLTALFCAWTMYLRKRGTDKLPIYLRAQVRWALFFLLLGMVAAGGYILRQDKFARATLENVRFAGDSEEERIVMWNESLHLAREHPLLGVGPGNWKYHALERGMVSSFQGFATRFFMRGHNDFLQAFAERGMLGGLAFLAIWLLGLGYGIWRMERGESREGQLWAAIGTCGLMGWMVIASFGFPMERTEECLFWLLILGMLVGGPARKGGSVRQGGGWAKLAVGGMMVLGLAFGGLTLMMVKADRHGLMVARAKAAQDWYTVHKEAKAALHWYYPGLSVSATPMEWYIGVAALLRGDPNGAFPYLEAAYHKHPWHPHVVSNYAATLYSRPGKEAEAQAILENLVAIFPEFHEVRANLTEVYLATGQLDKVQKNLTYWDNHVKPRDISLYCEQVKVKLGTQQADSISHDR